MELSVLKRQHALTIHHPCSFQLALVLIYMHDYCIVLYSIVLYCIVLYCIALYCIVLYCIVLYFIVLYCIALYCIVLYCIVFDCIVLHCIVLYCIVFDCIVLHCIELHCIELHCIEFTPLVISATGGLANEASTFYKRLASLLASKWDHPYSSTLCWLRCSLAFSLLRSAIQSIRGARSSCGHAIKTPTAVDLVNIESNISPGV